MLAPSYVPVRAPERPAYETRAAGGAVRRGAGAGRGPGERRQQIYVAARDSNAVTVFDRLGDGTLNEKDGTSACVADDGLADGCTDGRALLNTRSVAVSADGRHVYATALASNAIAVLKRDAGGVLTQAPEAGKGCIADSPAAASPACADAPALEGPYAVAVSRDGASVYATTVTDDSVVAFSRDPQSGDLTAIAAAEGGCFDAQGDEGCALDAGLDNPFGIAVSPDDKHVYVASQNGNRVLRYERRSGGGLTYVGCIGTGASGCAEVPVLGAPWTVALSEDGTSAYVISRLTAGGSITALDRGAAGILAGKAGATGCATLATLPPCAQSPGLNGAQALALSPDGRSVYVGATLEDAVASFRRDTSAPACSDAAASTAAATAVKIRLSCADADGDQLALSVVTPPAGGTLGAIDQATGDVVFAPAPGFAGDTSFSFKATGAGVDSAPATIGVDVGAPPCAPRPEIAGNGIDEDCDGADAIPVASRIAARVTYEWAVYARFTRVRRLAVVDLPAGATVAVRCSGRGCPPRRRLRPVVVSRPTPRLNLRRPFRRRELRPGAVIEVTITAPNVFGKRVRYTIRRRAVPTRRQRCLAPGTTTPARCP
jgi:hypothetical protein